MDRNQDVAKAIRQKDIHSIVQIVFEHGMPVLRSGFRVETELWDFKVDCPRLEAGSVAWAQIAKDVLAFHNLHGGLLVFGIDDSFRFVGSTVRLDSKLFNDQMRRYLGDRIWVEFHREFIQPDQRYIGIAVIPGRGPTFETFKSSAKNASGGYVFSKGESAIRQGDSSLLLSREETEQRIRELAMPTIGKLYAVDQPFFRILSPDYSQFILRSEPCAMIEKALSDPRAMVSSIVGIGGTGKTALATWAVLRAFERKDFRFIVSITAKDREMTAGGIQALTPSLTTYDSLLNAIADTLGFPEIKVGTTAEREKHVHDLIKEGNGLLFVDNLETVDDKRVITFLDNLPIGVRAITTSRRAAVRVSVHPVDLGPLTESEVVKFVNSLAAQPGMGYAGDLSKAESVRIGDACDRIPLAIRWALARSKSASEALTTADGITHSGKRGEELLEFCFRRIFDAMTAGERAVVEVLSLFQRPLLTEALLVGAFLPHHRLTDALEQLVEDALVQRIFDPDHNDYAYILLPITRAFVYTQVTRQSNLEPKIRKRLADYYEAKDVKDPEERLVVREVRQGADSSESALTDLASAAEHRGDHTGAEQLYQQALQRNPRSWRAARLFAEFQRHKLRNTSEALRLYEQAAANCPSRGDDRALIFREWGLLLKDSGDPNATDLAVEKFEESLRESPNDVIALTQLAQMLARKGFSQRVIQLLDRLEDTSDPKTRAIVLPLLENAYRRTGNLIKSAEISNKIKP